MSDDVEKKIEETKARIAQLQREAELKRLEAEAAALERGPVIVPPPPPPTVPTITAAEVSSAREAKSVPLTGIENLLHDEEVAAAYEEHKTKTPVSDKKEPIAAQIVQYLVIFRQERIDFTHSDKRTMLRHAATGALFLRTKSGDEGHEIVTDKGRQSLQTALMDTCDLRTLSAILTDMSLALAKAPNLPPGSEDSNAQASFRAAVNKMLGKAKTKEELGAMLLQMLGN